MKRVAISQSNYVPWKGYFDLIQSVDEFVLLDDVQYTKRDWRNRNLIKTPRGLRWLTIPVRTKAKFLQTIRDTEIADPRWPERHWQAICSAYRSAPGWKDCETWLGRLYHDTPRDRLSEVNRHFLSAICEQLGIRTLIRSSAEFTLSGDASQRLLGICRELDAGVYYSGPAAVDYLDQRIFGDAGIEIRWMQYEGYPAYRQLHGPFEHRVSILDLLLNEGRDAPRFITAARLDPFSP